MAWKKVGKIMYNLSRDYEKLFELICAGKIAVGFVDYKWSGDEVLRDVCKIERTKENNIFIYARGHGYGSVYPFSIEDSGIKEKEYFILMCKSCNLEFIMPTESEAENDEQNNTKI